MVSCPINVQALDSLSGCLLAKPNCTESLLPLRENWSSVRNPENNQGVTPLILLCFRETRYYR